MTGQCASHSVSQQLLLSQTELFNDSSVSFDIDLLEVIEEVSPVTDHFEQAATAVIVLVVVLEVLGEVGYSVSKYSYLNLGRARVTLVGRILLDNCLLFLCCHFRIHLSKIKFLQIRSAPQPSGEIRASYRISKSVRDSLFEKPCRRYAELIIS